jgi:hypothetical protein
MVHTCIMPVQVQGHVHTEESLRMYEIPKMESSTHGHALLFIVGDLPDCLPPLLISAIYTWYVDRRM